MTEETPAPKRTKFCYVGAPAIFALEIACQHIERAFDAGGCYLVGSCLERPDWRDVDVRLIMDDAEFASLFPDVNIEAVSWELDPRWLLMTVSLSQWLSAQTGLPVDFQFQPRAHANTKHKGKRHAIGRYMAPKSDR